MLRIAGVMALLVVTTGSCGPRSNAGSRTSATEISAEELRASTHADVYALVQAVRPQWLRVRGATSFHRSEVIRVYLDDLELGGTDALRRLTTGSIRSIRFLPGLEATQRWGLDHGAGAIVVTTR